MMILLCLCGGTNFGQTRIEQISQQLAFGVLELQDNEDSFAESHHSRTSDRQLSREVGDFSWALLYSLLLSLAFTILTLLNNYDRKWNNWNLKSVKL